MASELHLTYGVTYDVDIDVEVAKGHLNQLWQEAEGELDLFEEFVLDYVREHIQVFESYDELGLLPAYITSFSVTEVG
jgi:hypothetical protein